MNLQLLLGMTLGILFCGLPLYSVYCFVAACRHFLPDIEFAWVLRTGFSKHNFTDKGRSLRSRGLLMLLMWICVWFALGFYFSAYPPARNPRARTNPPAGARREPASSQSSQPST